MTRARLGWAVAAASLAVGVTRWLGRARVPDDYDSIGFVRAIERFDLAELQPHPPGYPVYVALCKAMHAVVPALGDLGAACAVSAIAAAVTAAALFVLVSTLANRRAGAVAIALYTVAFSPWFLGGAALSDGTAGAFAVVAFALSARRRFIASAVVLALGLGVRPSWFPLALSWLVLLVVLERSRRGYVAAAVCAFVVAMVAWLVPFALVVGPAKLVALSRAHVSGHFVEWGGTVVTRPQLGARALAWLRDLFYDGLAPNGAALACVVVLTALAARTPSGSYARLCKAGLCMRPARWIAAAIVLPYGAWVLFAQNVLEQPRHLLPLVLVVLVVLAIVLSQRPLFAALAVGALGAASVPLVIERVRTPPAAAQLADYVMARFDPARTMVFGARAIRFLPPRMPSRPRTWLSEVDVELERVDVLPADVLVTNEVEADAVRARRLHPLATFCRDRRLDRAWPCLTLSRYALTP
jgi:hypothetical protein